ncbi:DUF1704 domain-containing protein, partial [bacterium]|nr:DUF1704 domain-containing protein [bacterium]
MANAAMHPHSHKIGRKSFIIEKSPLSLDFSEEYSLSLMIPTEKFAGNTEKPEKCRKFSRTYIMYTCFNLYPWGDAAKGEFGMWATYKERLKQFSERLVEAQKPVRLIDGVKWDSKVLEEVRKSKYRELPKVDAAYYDALPLSFDPAQKIAEFQSIIDDLVQDVGAEDPLGRILIHSCREFQDLVRMLGARGRPEFYEISKRLYGSPQDHFFGSLSTVKDLGLHLYNILSVVQTRTELEEKKVEVAAKEAMRDLEERFGRYFAGQNVKVTLEDEMVADAAASAKTIKLRQAATFTKRDIDILEVHEGWVHMGTTINGLEQRIARFLHKGPP